MTCRFFKVTIALATLIFGATRVDADLIVAEYGNNDILRISDNGSSTTTFASSNLNNPIGIGLDSSGNVYAVNSNSVAKFSPTGTSEGFYVPSGSTTLSGPIDIAFDGSNNGYVTNDNGNSTASFFISKYDSSGTYQGFFGTTTNLPTGIGYDSASATKDLYVSNSGNNSISIYDPTASPLMATIITPTGAGQLNNPQQIAFDSAGNVYIANFGTGDAGTGANVQEFDSSLNYIKTFTATGTGAEGVAVDPSGNVYVSLLNGGGTVGTIEKFNAAGTDLGTIATGLNDPAYIQYVQPVPEPGTLTLAGIGLAGLAGYHSWRRKRSSGLSA